MDIFNTFEQIKQLCSTHLSNAKEYIISDERDYVPFIKSIDWEGICYKGFMVYITIATHTKNIAIHLYNNYPEVKRLVDFSLYSVKYVNSKVNKSRIEPWNDNWVRTSFLLKNNDTFFNGDKYIYMENYEYLNTDTNDNYSPKDMIQNGFDYFYKIIESMCKTNDNIIQTMITMRKDNKYSMSICYDNHNNPPSFKAPFKEVSNPFISIEYSNAENTNKLVIEPQHCWFVGNSMLSSIHVRQILEYQEEKFDFDLDYILNVIDVDMNMYTIKNHQYIYINEDGKAVLKNTNPVAIDKNNSELDKSMSDDEN
jgi:hypothetical protein